MRVIILDTSSPKDALAAAKRLVEMGVLQFIMIYVHYVHIIIAWFQKVNIKKQTAKTTGFKRVGEGANRVSCIHIRHE